MVLFIEQSLKVYTNHSTMNERGYFEKSEVQFIPCNWAS
jgi:hypothetical protein